ncbi:plasmid stabilization protein [Salmonella enterica subsp. enterica serovar Newport]|nr:plasmid stabilization protein [Salmonella enterica subsp. enterica serovar Newport]
MGDMLLRGVPDAIKTELKQFASESGKSLSETAVDVLRKGIAARKADRDKPRQSAWDLLRAASVESEAIDHDGEYVRIMDEIEAERKRDFGRPVPDFE